MAATDYAGWAQKKALRSPQNEMGLLASQGRNGDTRMAHVSEGEVVIPREVVATHPDLMNGVSSAIQGMGGNPDQYQVGSGTINPHTGAEEFASQPAIRRNVVGFSPNPPGLTRNAPALTTKASGLTTKASGLTTKASAPPVFIPKANAGPVATPLAPVSEVGRTTLNPVTNWNVTPNQTVQGQVKSLIDEGNPLMEASRRQASNDANSRGMLNSTMASSAGQAAMFDTALDIARPDAEMHGKSASYNADMDNQFTRAQAELDAQRNEFNSGAKNQSNLQGAELDYSAARDFVESQFKEKELFNDQHEFGETLALNRDELLNDKYEFGETQAFNREELNERIKEYKFNATIEMDLAKLANENDILLNKAKASSDYFNNTMSQINATNLNPDLDQNAKDFYNQEAMRNLNTGMGLLDITYSDESFVDTLVDPDDTRRARKPYGSQKFQPEPPPKSGKVICTRLNELGLLDYDVFKLDSEYGQYLLANDSMVIVGYHSWGRPMVRAMHGKSKRSRLLIKVVRVLALPVANEMANRVSGVKGGFLIGATVDAMLSVCRVLGKRIRNGRNKCASPSL